MSNCLPVRRQTVRRRTLPPVEGLLTMKEVSCGPVRLTANLAECYPKLRGSLANVHVDVNGLMTRAFGVPLIQSGGEDTVDV